MALTEAQAGVLMTSMSDDGCALTLGRSRRWVARRRAELRAAEPVQARACLASAPWSPPSAPEGVTAQPVSARAAVRRPESSHVVPAEVAAVTAPEVPGPVAAPVRPAFVPPPRKPSKPPPNHTKLNAENVPMLGGAGIPKADDRQLVRDCLAQGGFPRAVTMGDGRTVWAGPDGGPWAGRFAKRKRRAA